MKNKSTFYNHLQPPKKTSKTTWLDSSPVKWTTEIVGKCILVGNPWFRCLIALSYTVNMVLGQPRRCGHLCEETTGTWITKGTEDVSRSKSSRAPPTAGSRWRNGLFKGAEVRGRWHWQRPLKSVETTSDTQWVRSDSASLCCGEMNLQMQKPPINLSNSPPNCQSAEVKLTTWVLQGPEETSDPRRHSWKREP